MKKLLIIVPAYNEEKVLAGVLNGMPAGINGIDEVSVLVIDDGSTDRTAEIASSKGVKIISNKKNYGVGVSMARGMEYALRNHADIAVNIDADGQFDPAEISKLIEPIIKDEADFVSGSRFFSGKPVNMSHVKYYGNIVMTKIISLLADDKFRDVSCGFRAYNRDALLNLNLFGRYTYTQEMFLNLKFKNIRITEVAVDVKYFKDRKSKVANNLFKYGLKTMGIILRSVVYYKPLKFFSYPGLSSMLIGLFFVCFLLIHKLKSGMFSPYKAYGFVGGGFLIFGLILVLIGLLADIIDKTRQVQEKSLYFLKKNEYDK